MRCRVSSVAISSELETYNVKLTGILRRAGFGLGFYSPNAARRKMSGRALSYACIEGNVQRDQFAAQAVEHRTGELNLTFVFDGESLKPAIA